MSKVKGPKVLLLDIETAPILGYVWSLWQNDLGINQIEKDWSILSFAAKWLGDKEDKMLYMDQRSAKNVENDKRLLKRLWSLLDEADVIITQNGKSFDIKKINARFIINGLSPPSSFKHIDTKLMASKYFGFTSNGLEYLSQTLCKKYRKHKHSKFAGMELWKQCLAGNKAAWKEMEVYNKLDVLSLEELYNVLKPWGDGVNFNLYNDSLENTCKCGSKKFSKNGFFYTNVGRYQRYKCKECGSETRDRKNLLSKEKKASLKAQTVR